MKSQKIWLKNVILSNCGIVTLHKIKDRLRNLKIKKQLKKFSFKRINQAILEFKNNLPTVFRNKG